MRALTVEPGHAKSARLEEVAEPPHDQKAVPLQMLAVGWMGSAPIGARSHWSPRRVVVTGAGPIGLLAALIGRQQSYEVHLFDRETSGIKPALARSLGAHYHTEGLTDLLKSLPADIVLECTGADAVVLDVMTANARGAITCLVGVSAAGRTIPVDLGKLNRSMVLENDVVFGSVNANRAHYEAAAEVLERADSSFLEQVIARRVPLERWAEALERKAGDVKVIIELAH